MGTNYYLEDTPPCTCCGRPFPTRHIGKSSGGWCFSLHVYPEDGIDDWDDWLPLIRQSNVVDEYGRIVPTDEMIRIVTERSWPRNENLSSNYLERNQSQLGPDGLLRHKIGRHCISHGKGTWDCIVGEFS